MPLISSLRDLSERRVIVLAFIAALLIGVADFLTGWEVSLFFFYAVPIFIVGYRAGRSKALLLAAVSAVVWWAGNVQSHPYESKIAFIWVTITRGAYMLFVAYGADLLKRLRDVERERSAALEREGELRRDMIRAVEQQQRFFVRELHDGVCQLLSGAALATGSLAQRLEAKSATEANDAREIEGFVRKALSETRLLAHGLFPVQMGSEGLPAALDELALTSSQMVPGVRIRFSQAGPTVAIVSDVAMHLYRIAQEAVANAIKHAHAENISVALSSVGGRISLEVVDDGVGIGPIPDREKGIGLRTMAYRAAEIGALLEISARKPCGTRVVCLLPNTSGITEIMDPSHL